MVKHFLYWHIIILFIQHKLYNYFYTNPTKPFEADFNFLQLLNGHNNIFVFTVTQNACLRHTNNNNKKKKLNYIHTICTNLLNETIFFFCNLIYYFLLNKTKKKLFSILKSLLEQNNKWKKGKQNLRETTNNNR